MIWSLQIILYITLLLILLGIGQWIACGLGTVGIIGLILSGKENAFRALGSIAWNSTNSFELTAVPLFLFMGEFVMRCGISDIFYRGISKWVNRLPGGLLQSNIIACAFFAAISGSSVATAAAMGTVAIPELAKRGYERKMVFGSLAGGGTLGILIPPSIPFIVYGNFVDESIAKLFMAGVVPGIVLSIIFMIYISIRCMYNNSLAPPYNESITWKEKAKGLADMLPMIILILLIMGSIYMGIATPTEAAAVGTVASIFMSVALRCFTWEGVKSSLANSVRTTCMVLFIVIGAQILSYMLVSSKINRDLSEWVISLNLSFVGLLIILIIIYFILGCLMDGLSMMFITLPVLYPIIRGVGFDPIWFGVVLVILIELAQITPPMGLNLFVIQGISNRPIDEVIMGSIPYFFLLLLLIVIISFFPSIVLWLPGHMFSR